MTRKALGLGAVVAGISLAVAAIVTFLSIDPSAAEHPAAYLGPVGTGAPPMTLRAVAAYVVAIGGAVSLVGAGWGAWLHVKFNAGERKSSGIGKALDAHMTATTNWRDTFTERYRNDREAMIREYATQVSLEKVEERMEAIRTELMDGMRSVQGSVDKLRDALKNSGG